MLKIKTDCNRGNLKKREADYFQDFSICVKAPNIMLGNHPCLLYERDALPTSTLEPKTESHKMFLSRTPVPSNSSDEHLPEGGNGSGNHSPINTRFRYSKQRIMLLMSSSVYKTSILLIEL